MSDQIKFTQRELESVRTLKEAREHTSLSEDTLKRCFASYVINLTERRKGMRLKHILQIASGELAATSD